MFTLLSRLVRVHEPPARAGERRTDRAARQPGLGGDLLVREPRIPQQQDLAIARRQLLERGADLRPLALRVQCFVHRRRAVLRLGPEQRQVTPLARPASSIVSRHVRRHDEEPPPGVLRLVYQCSGERLLRQVRSEEHTSELQSPCNLVCRLLLEKKKKKKDDLKTKTSQSMLV